MSEPEELASAKTLLEMEHNSDSIEQTLSGLLYQLAIQRVLLKKYRAEVTAER